MKDNNQEKFEKLEKQIGTLKFVILIMAAALIYNSAIKTGMLGDYKITANTVAAKKIILKGDNNQNLGILSVSDKNQVSIILNNADKQIKIKPDNIKFYKIDDSVDKIIFKIPDWNSIKSFFCNLTTSQNQENGIHKLLHSHD